MLLILLMLCGMSVTAYAEDVTISATVPDRHTVTVEADGGKIVINGHVCGASIQVERLREQTYWIIPDAGKTLEALYYNGEDVTGQVKAGVFTAPELIGDATLKAVFQNAPSAPGKEYYNISGTVTDGAGKPVPGATVDIGGHTGVTDQNGTFLIKDVPPGTWPVVITDGDETIIGIGEITIGEPGGGSLTVTTDGNGNPVITPGKGTETIGMTLVISVDGTISVRNIKDATPSTPNQPAGSGDTSPKTGDDNQMLLCLALLLLACGGLIALVFFGRRKNKSTGS